MDELDRINEALQDGAAALKYRAERLRDVARNDDEWNMVAQFYVHAETLEKLAAAKPVTT